jgi:ABC-type uncharacterized transport system fused permease/ATPase subunit
MHVLEFVYYQFTQIIMPKVTLTNTDGSTTDFFPQSYTDPIDLALGLFSSFLTAITFIGILWSVGDSLIINLSGLSVTVPGYLVIAVIVFEALGLNPQ